MAVQIKHIEGMRRFDIFFFFVFYKIYKINFEFKMYE